MWVIMSFGYPELVLITPEEYEELARAREKQRIYDAIAKAEAQIDAGQWVSGDDLLESLGNGRNEDRTRLLFGKDNFPFRYGEISLQPECPHAEHRSPVA